MLQKVAAQTTDCFRSRIVYTCPTSAIKTSVQRVEYQVKMKTCLVILSDVKSHVFAMRFCKYFCH